MKTVFNALLLTTVVTVSTQAQAAQVREVTFENQGQTLAGNLYLPDDFVEGQELPGVVVTGSWTSTKEQMSGLYAEELAERGFAALAFDFRNFGDSEGAVRAFESPAMKIEDIKAAASFIRNSCIRYWMDNESVGKYDLSSYCKVLADHVCECGCTLDRDENAARNILMKGLRTVGHTGTLGRLPS